MHTTYLQPPSHITQIFINTDDPDMPHCSGSIIQNTPAGVWVLTAAHCLMNLEATQPPCVGEDCPVVFAKPATMAVRVLAGGVPAGRSADIGVHAAAADGKAGPTAGGGCKQSLLLKDIAMVEYTYIPSYWRRFINSNVASTFGVWWDVGLIKLKTTKPLRCAGGVASCSLAPAYNVDSMPSNLSVLGFPAEPLECGKAHLSHCDKELAPDEGMTMPALCGMHFGMSGGPLYMRASTLPPGVLRNKHPQLGVTSHSKTYSDGTHKNFWTLLTPAHLKWIYWAGPNKATYYACSSLSCQRYPGIKS